ncbi:Pre-mRNA 3'-end-processing factor FIP1 [Chionoecetes opilio]|uniref:Pre-mRNA 3'-end-processing factor FIP1 n=1 Tax=Chionoecetes opilio TaxID=41210 RepID=A0A8J5D0Q2_CHIOP|nr:Pre-mRNA 3'-end-processing factor FIP1 [Chionoecetes opilio]
MPKDRPARPTPLLWWVSALALAAAAQLAASSQLSANVKGNNAAYHKREFDMNSEAQAQEVLEIPGHLLHVLGMHYDLDLSDDGNTVESINSDLAPAPLPQIQEPFIPAYHHYVSAPSAVQDSASPASQLTQPIPVSLLPSAVSNPTNCFQNTLCVLGVALTLALTASALILLPFSAQGRRKRSLYDETRSNEGMMELFVDSLLHSPDLEQCLPAPTHFLLPPRNTTKGVSWRGMAEVQDDDQWLYGDDKDDPREEGGEGRERPQAKDKAAEENGNEETPAEEGEEGEEEEEEEVEKDKDKDEDKEKDKDKDKDGEKEKDGEEKEDEEMEGEKEGGEKGDDDDSSDEDDLTVTIGALKTQPDIIQAPTAPHGARFQPKATPTAGLKDEDFSTPGKVNGVPVTEFNLAELEEKPWRKPGADISDYFNYGFNEETWFRYCERQKRMRINESGAGLAGLGISITKPFGNAPNTIPVTIVNDNSKYGGAGCQRPKAGPPPRNKGMGQIDVIGGAAANKTSTIQVMTADRREYSNKVMSGPPPPLPSQPNYNDMEFGGNPYGETYYPGDAPPPFYGGGGGGFDNPQPPWGSGPPPPIGQNNWDGPGPGPLPPPSVTPVSSGPPPGYFEEDSMSAPPPLPEPEEERHSDVMKQIHSASKTWIRPRSVAVPSAGLWHHHLDEERCHYEDYRNGGATGLTDVMEDSHTATLPLQGHSHTSLRRVVE